MPNRKKKATKRRRVESLRALRLESERIRNAMIRDLLGLPMNKRVWFLRVRHPNAGSHV
jgi:hypothetical protein